MVIVENVLGIFFAIIAAICFNLTPVIQKEALDQMHEVSFSNVKKSLKKMFTNKKWLVGGIIGIAGGIPFILAINLVGISVVQPVMNFGIVILVLVSEKKLGEKISRRAKFAILLMILMPFLIGYSKVSNVQADISEISTRNNMFIFTGIIITLIIIFIILQKKNPIFLAPIVGLFFALGAYYMQAYMSMLSSSGYNFIQDFNLIIQNTFKDINIIIANIYFISLIIFNGLAAYVLQIGLQKVPVSYFNPIQQTINNIVAIISGLVIFGQNVSNWFFYLIGIIFGIFSIFLLGDYQISPSVDEKYISENT